MPYLITVYFPSYLLFRLTQTCQGQQQGVLFCVASRDVSQKGEPRRFPLEYVVTVDTPIGVLPRVHQVRAGLRELWGQ